jgi:STAM-binding protein
MSTLASRASPALSSELIAPLLGGLRPIASKLRIVFFPRDCLNRFVSIASINTAQNRETCGLLLGKYKGGRYVVTTLLIPKQHATGDSCAIDAEELVMQFTEGRSLIILGWVYRHFCWWTVALRSLVRYFQIHTHPTQPCVCFVEMLGCAMT